MSIPLLLAEMLAAGVDIWMMAALSTPIPFPSPATAACWGREVQVKGGARWVKIEGRWGKEAR